VPRATRSEPRAPSAITLRRRSSTSRETWRTLQRTTGRTARSNRPTAVPVFPRLVRCPGGR
jgi:hypothetical protein